MIHANKYKNIKLPIPVVTSFFLSDFGKFIFIPFAMKQVTRKRTIMKVIDNHLCSSLSSIPSKRNVAMTPPISAKPMRSQKSLLVSFLMIFFCSSETADSVGGASSRLVGRVLSFPDGSDVHLPDIFPSSFDSG
jgi:hypothetical protein